MAGLTPEGLARLSEEHRVRQREDMKTAGKFFDGLSVVVIVGVAALMLCMCCSACALFGFLAEGSGY